MLDGKLAEIYRSLWDLTYEPRTSERWSGSIPVLYQLNDQPAFRRGEAGIFMTHLLPGWPAPGDYVAIWIARSGQVPAQSSEPDLEGATLEELLTLAHERGHERSYRAGTYVDNETAGAMDEERRAWKHARDILTELTFTDWAAFDAAEAHSLEMHKQAGTPD